MNADTAIRTEGVHRRFGDVIALAGIDLEVERGTVFGLLGHNGAGKTTLVRILTTLLPLDSGRAWVDGLDVASESALVRACIGLTGQFAAIDADLTGRENLVLIGRLLGFDRHESRRRADELLERFDLADAATRRGAQYSGGMRRRLDLAASLVGRPSVLFLDEPTTGLDPTSRQQLWEVIVDLTGSGTTVLLTTQYLEEADRLAHRIAMLDHGHVVAEGTAAELKARVGGHVIGVRFPDLPALQAATAALVSTHPGLVTDPPNFTVRIPVEGPEAVAPVVREIDAAGVPITELALHAPTLDDVFFAFTGTLHRETSQAHPGDHPAGRPEISSTDDERVP